MSSNNKTLILAFVMIIASALTGAVIYKLIAPSKNSTTDAEASNTENADLQGSESRFKVEDKEESEADLENLNSVNIKWAKLSVPGNWTVDEEADRLFIIKLEKLTEYNQWGDHAGQGMQMSGSLESLYPGKIIVFYCKKGEKAFLLTQVTYTKYESTISSGLKLLAESFEFSGDNSE